MEYLHKFYMDMKRDGIIFCFNGPTSQSIIESIGTALRKKMEVDNAGRGTIQRVFSIFIELMQNIINYTEPDIFGPEDEGPEFKHGIVIVGRDEDKFYIISGNRIHQSESEKVLESIKALQQMNRQELKEHYQRMRRLEPEEQSKGAGLGLIEMFRRASEPLECHISPLDAETAFLSIKATG